MITISQEYITKIKNDIKFADEIRNELFTSILLNKLIDTRDFILGKEGQYPDLFLDNEKVGYEIVQCDLDEDLNQKRLLRLLKESNYNFKALKNNALLENFNIDPYYFLLDKEENVVGISSTNEYLGREPYYFLPIFINNYGKKIKKLTNGNYNNCDKVSLIIEAFGRAKTKNDIKKIIGVFSGFSKKYNKAFEDIIIFTAGFAYLLNQQRTITIEPSIYTNSIEETNRILKQYYNSN